MVKVVLQRLGEIPEESVRNILSVIQECYESLKPDRVEILDLLLFPDPSSMHGFYSRERSALHVVTEDLDESFIALHDAWRGTSRIGVCMSRMRELPPLVQVGTLRHEVGHSVLHGALEYYVFPISAPLIEAAKRLGFSKEYSFNLLYLISIAVKDFEVTRLLSEKGYVDDQVAYSNHVLGTSNEDLDAWQLSKGNPAGMALCLAGRLKDAACLVALQPRLGDQSVVDTLRGQLSYLPHPILDEMLKTLKRFPQAIGGDTFQNVTVMTKIFVEDLLHPLFVQS
ncbi:MAG: hypothetical protein ABSD49_14960 [Candidatus Bathyarchaeia archaeon]